MLLFIYKFSTGLRGFARLQDKKNRKIGTGLSLPIYLKDRIDNERGDISRSKYILRMLEKVEYREESKKTQVESRCQPYTQSSEHFRQPQENLKVD